MTLTVRTGLPLASVLLAGIASGQEIYIDFGSGSAGFGVPSSSYAAAAPNPGTWNDVDLDFIAATPWTSMPLVDTTGTATAVTITMQGNGGSPFQVNFNNGTTLGDDEALMDDIFYFSGFHQLDVDGLSAGSYDVYSYGWAPDSAAFFTSVSVTGSTDPPQCVGGTFAGHALGVTYAKHSVTIGTGGTITIDFDVCTSFDSINGVQIVPGSGGPGPIGTNYGCPTTVPNSSGGPAAIAATGSEAAADNDVTLATTGMPTNQFGYYLNSQIQNPNGFLPPGSQGNLCVGPSGIGRYNTAVFNTGANGEGSLVLDLASTPTPSGNVSIMAGETWYWTTWFRDNNPNPTSNFSDGVCITFN